MSNAKNENLIPEIQHYGPVTALKFLQDTLLVGSGPVLKLFRIHHGHWAHLWLKRVFRRNKIHSIAICEKSGRVALCGSRSFAVLNLENDEEPVEKAINEWIIGTEFLSDVQLAILTSHNQILVVNLDFSSESKFEVDRVVHCNEKSILYSGSITKTNDGHIYVAAGTVMDGVIVWDLNSRKVVHHLKDHEGSIFAVKIDETAKYLVSCSDDRSIKAYDFPSGSLLSSGWGHGSRIWSLLFTAVSDCGLRLVSMGEDCSTRLWEYNGDSILKCSKVFDYCHEGKHIWSGDADSQTTKCLATGGADGKVRLLDIDPNAIQLLQYSLQDIFSATNIAMEAKEHIKLFRRLPSINLIVILTSSGKIFTQNATLGWACINTFDPINEVVSLHSMPSRNMVVVVTKIGSMILCTFEPESLMPKSKQLYLTGTPYKFMNSLTSISEDSMSILLDSPIKSSPFVVLTIQFVNNGPHIASTVELKKPTDCAFTPTSMHYDSKLRKIFVGSRHANLAVYDLSTKIETPYLIRKVCDGDTVTSLSPVPVKKNDVSLYDCESEMVLLVTVRDGVYLYIRFKSGENGLTHEIIHQNKYTKGSLEGSFVLDEQLFLYGFRSSAFYLWNETNQIEIINETCGGAHRQWEFIRTSDSSKQSSFAFINKSNLVLRLLSHRFGLTSAGLLATGTHGREIRSVAVSSHAEIDGSRLIATASEDATVKLGRLYEDGRISINWTMNNHISGLQSIKFATKDYFISSAANEELIVWGIDRFGDLQFSVVEKARIDVSGNHSDLRVMDFSTLEMDDGLLIAAIYSNSVAKIFFYNFQTRNFTTVANTVYSQYCLLNVQLLKLDNEVFLCVGATDGYLTIWNVSNCRKLANFEFPAPEIKQQLHQSAIKATEFVCNEESKGWDIFTGGDDNALVHLFLFVKNNKLHVEQKSYVEKAASATITGIVSIGNGQVFVTSVDQIVRLWNYTGDLACVAATYTTVADTGCCEFVNFGQEKLAIACGAGVSIFKLC